MGTAHCLGHSCTGPWTGTAGGLCPAGCRCSLCQPRWTQQSGEPEPRDPPQPAQPCPAHTHGDSSAGQPARGSQACSGHSVGPPYGVSSAGTAPCGGHRHQGPWGQCSHCTHMAGTCHLAGMGPQSAQGHKLRTAALPTGRGGMSVLPSCLTRPAPTLYPLTRVACPAVAHDLLGVPIPMARSREVPLAPGGLRAGAGPALAPVWQPRVPVEARDAPAWRGGGSGVVPEQPAARPGAAPTHLSQCSPPVWSRQPRHVPVWVSHSSACPLHTHGRQLGNPHWPCWQRSQRSPKAPARQGHCPLAPSHRPLRDPSGLHWQAGGKAGLSPRG